LKRIFKREKSGVRPGKKAKNTKRTVPKSATGGLIENIKAFEITILKELGKMTL
jgi:hypothetical protein